MDGALRRIGEPTVQDLEVRRGQYGPTGGACSCEALKDEDVRGAAAEALGAIGDKSAITPLKARLRFLGIFGGEKVGYVRAEIKAAIKKLEGS